MYFFIQSTVFKIKIYYDHEEINMQVKYNHILYIYIYIYIYKVTITHCLSKKS
jgi:hypothetical protein